MQILHATSPEHYAAVLAAHPRLLVDYWKNDCPGCRMLDASLQKAFASGRVQDMPVLKVQLEVVGEALFRGLGLRQTPTLSLFLDGTEISRLPGFQTPAQIERAVVEGFAQVPA